MPAEIIVYEPYEHIDERQVIFQIIIQTFNIAIFIYAFENIIIYRPNCSLIVCSLDCSYFAISAVELYAFVFNPYALFFSAGVWI